MTKKQLAFTLIAVIGIIIVGVSIHYSNILMGEPELVNHDFDGIITMNVPKDSNFVIEDHRTQNVEHPYFGYINKGEYGYHAAIVFIGHGDGDIVSGDLVEEYGNIKVTTSLEDKSMYNLYIKNDNCQIMISGGNLNLLKKMAETLEIKNLDSLQPQTTVVSTVS